MDTVTAEAAGNTYRSHDCQHTLMEFKAFIWSFRCRIGRLDVFLKSLKPVGPSRQAGRKGNRGARRRMIPLCGAKHAFHRSKKPPLNPLAFKGKALARSAQSQLLNHSAALTRLVNGVVVLHQEGVAVVPDLLAGLRVVLGLQRLQLLVEDALAHHDVDGRLSIPSGHRQGSLPHGMHWGGEEEEEESREETGRQRERREGKMERFKSVEQGLSAAAMGNTQRPTVHVVLRRFFRS